MQPMKLYLHVMFTCQVKNQQVLEWSQVLMTTDVVVLPCMHVHSLSIFNMNKAPSVTVVINKKMTAFKYI